MDRRTRYLMYALTALGVGLCGFTVVVVFWLLA